MPQDMRLTDTAIRAAKATDKAQKLFDGGGLFLFIAPKGGKLWRLKYRFGGAEKLLSLGAYPQIALKDARKLRDEAKELLAKGIDPGCTKKAAKEALHTAAANTFEMIAREWWHVKKSGWVTAHAEKILGRLENYIFPVVGKKAITDIKPPELLAALRIIEERGKGETARRALQNCSQIFRYAIATGRAERDPASDLRGALAPVISKNFATITDTRGVGALLRSLHGYEGYFPVCCALRMAPYVFVRPGELRQAEWAEFDLENAEWRIPAARMKMRELHIVPLARQVVAVLRELQPYTGHLRYLFPSVRTATRPISDVTLLAGLRRLGYTRDAMCVHGFRSMASTLLNELGYNRDWIERQLAHGERNDVRAAYNYAEYLPERRKMMQEWADYLDRLRAEITHNAA